MSNLPVKSTSRGIQRAHTRRIQTVRGVKDVVVNPSVRKELVIRKELPAVRSSHGLIPRKPQDMMKPLAPDIKLRPKLRPFPWWNDRDEFEKRASLIQDIDDAAHEVNNVDVFWQDVFDMFQGLNPHIMDEKDAEKALNEFAAEFVEGPWGAHANWTALKQDVTLTRIANGYAYDVNRWNNDGFVIGVNLVTMDPSGPGREFSLIEIKDRKIDGMIFELPKNHVKEYIRRNYWPAPRLEDTVDLEYDTFKKLKDLSRKIPEVTLVQPVTWYKDSMLLAVPKNELNKAKKFLLNVGMEIEE